MEVAPGHKRWHRRPRDTGPLSSTHQDCWRMPGHAAATDTEEVKWAQDRQDISPRHRQSASQTHTLLSDWCQHDWQGLGWFALFHSSYTHQARNT